MKKFLGFVIITSFACSYAMESQEVRTLSIINEWEYAFTLIVTLKDQKPYKRRLVPQNCQDSFVIKNLDNLVSLGLGSKYQTSEFAPIDLTIMTGYKHILLALKFIDMDHAIVHSQMTSLKKPLSMEYPEFNCLCGYVTSRMMDTTRYFPGAYNCARTNYSIPGLYTQMNMDLISANALLNVPDNCERGDAERAYAELCEIWNPEQFDNPHQRTFAKRMMDVLNKKYELINLINSHVW